MKLTTQECDTFWQHVVDGCEHLDHPTPWSEIWCMACAMRDFTTWLVTARMATAIRWLLPSRRQSASQPPDDAKK